ncbi:UNVERIFIED_ORG: hypothetical protein J2W16_002654 [Pseudomonas cremoricolorata]|nr:hypothetical protein [Pseudomonas cremoricolorata]
MDRLNQENTRIPEEFHAAFEMCFTAHDVMLSHVRSGISQGIFTVNLDLSTDDRRLLEQSEDLFDWLKSSGRAHEEVRVVSCMVFPAIMLDALTCLFESLEAARKGKMAVAFMLLRKPLQEALYLLESMAIDQDRFASDLAQDPLKLRPHVVGGVQGHEARIQKVLQKTAGMLSFDAGYLARLRYDKSCSDSFDGVCNKAMHLITENRHIKTEVYNVNFIFSDYRSVYSQWSYFFSRLPYVLMYLVAVTEYIASRFALTFPEYTEDMMRRLVASLALSSARIRDDYRAEPLDTLVSAAVEWLDSHCLSHGYKTPEIEHLPRMARCGAFPDETDADLQARHDRYAAGVKKT